MLIEGGGADDGQRGSDRLLRSPSPRITRDLERHRGPALIDAAGRLLLRGRGQLAMVFALLMALSVALAYAARPEAGLLTAPDAQTTIAGLAASLPRSPDADTEVAEDPDAPAAGGIDADPDAAEAGGVDAGQDDAATESAAPDAIGGGAQDAGPAAPPATPLIPDSVTTAVTTPTPADPRSTTSQPPSSLASSTPAGPASTTAPTTPSTTPPITVTRPKTTTSNSSVRSINLLSGGSFERPRVADGDWAQFERSAWQTTGPVEIWGTGHGGVESYAGRQHLELNGVGATTISQKVAVEPGATYAWSFAHRGRMDVDTIDVLVDGAVVATAATGPDSWVIISGEVVMGPDQTRAVFGLRAVDAGSFGNLVDAVSFKRTG